VNVLLAPAHPSHPGPRAIKRVVFVVVRGREMWMSDNTRTGNITKMTTKMPEHLMEVNQLPKQAMEWFLATGRKRLHPQQGSAAADKPRMTRCITANVLQTNKVDAQGDQLVTELS